MAKIQGEFVSEAAAQKAKDAMIAAGIAPAHIRIWNILPHAPGGQSGSDTGAASGILLGGALGGAAGLGVGAAIGAAWDESSGSASHRLAPAGVRLVVDIAPGQDSRDEADLISLLQQAGAANIHEGT